MKRNFNELSNSYLQLIAEQPNLRLRNAAAELNCSELELILATNANAVLLRPKFQAILSEIESLGYVMALTRNNSVVHERKGVYMNAELENPHVGLFVGKDIDLRIFFATWKYAIATSASELSKASHSIQFYNEQGEAIHKIFLTSKSNLNAFSALVEKYIWQVESIENELQIQPLGPPETTKNELLDSEIDVLNFQNDWVNLKDTHHFFGLLKKYKVSRTQALRLAPEGNYAVRVDNSAFKYTLTQAAETETSIMVFVGNTGMIQIHTGPIKKLLQYGDWYNILDPKFNLHVNETHISQSYIVRKPTTDGMVTSLECYDANGELIVQFFGERKPGISELDAWREIIYNTQLKFSSEVTVNE